MNGEISLLIGEIEKSLAQLARLEDLYRQSTNQLAREQRTLEKAVFLSEVFVNTYTCMETLFFRISQFFENSLTQEQWHRDLLDKMRLRIPDIREPVISDETFALLDEFRRFRHFKRYYFSMDYDWDRIDYLARKFERLSRRYPDELRTFSAFLERLKE